MSERTTERARVLEYPFEYFDVQVQFAKKWSQLSREPLAQTLLERTALYRRLIGKWAGGELDLQWSVICSEVEDNPDRASALITRRFTLRPDSRFVPPHYPEDDRKHFRSFSYDYYADRKTVKVHYIVADRGHRSGLAREHLDKRRADLKSMFESIKDYHPDAEIVMGGSWLYNLDAYRRIFPPSYTENMIKLVPPQLSFSGNSVWGQFIDSLGGPKLEVVSEFTRRINQAGTTEDLVNAFPYPTLQPTGSIEDFYSFLGINKN